MNDPEFGSLLSRQLCLQYVLTDPVAFRDYWVPKVVRRPYWHRLNFTPILHKIDDGDSSVYQGRGSGKSFAILEPEIVRWGVNHPGEESMVTSLRSAHTADRMERAIEYFETIPFFKMFVVNIKRSPLYEIKLKTGHVIYGVAVGDDAEAKMAQGKHVSRLMIEEAHQFPERAFLKVMGSKDPRGCITLMIGVPDGRLNTPFRRADGEYDSFRGRNIHLSRRSDPLFDRKTKRELIDFYKGEDSELFKQEVDAEWGQPTWGAWDMDDIYRCQSDELLRVYQKEEFDGQRYKHMKISAAALLADLTGRFRQGRCVVALDVGYTQPTSIGVFEEWLDRWYLIARIELTNKMEHDAQSEFIAEIGRRYQAERIAIDATEGEGRAIAQTLEQTEQWKDRIIRVAFQESLLTGWEAPKEGEETELKETWEPTKSVATRELRRMFSAKKVALPKDDKIYGDFNAELEHRTPEGMRRVITPANVHITDMMRVFAIERFHANPPMPPNTEYESSWDIDIGERHWPSGHAYL